MLFKSALVTQASGSIGGMTASHNRFGQYMRARTIPVNPNSTDQIAIRGAMTFLAQRWITGTTSLNRAGWKTYAENTPVLNKLGDPITLTGQQMYIRSNLQRVRVSPSLVVDIPPTVNDLGDFTALGVGASVATQTVSVAYDNADSWAIATGGFLFIRIGVAQNPTINFYGGPFRLGASVVGDTTTPPTSPEAIVYTSGVLALGQKIFVRATAAQPDGRYSNSKQYVGTVAA